MMLMYEAGNPWRRVEVGVIGERKDMVRSMGLCLELGAEIW